MNTKQLNIRKFTRERLVNISTKGQSYDTLIKMLLEKYSDKISKIKVRKYNSPYTIILISEETKDELKKLGNKRNTYDDILNELIDLYEGVNNENEP